MRGYRWSIGANSMRQSRCSVSGHSTLVDDLSWLERARRLVDYHQEALEFIGRAGQQIPANPTHALAVGRLWLEADGIDDRVCTLLDELNSGLLGGNGELDTTRGVAMRPSQLGEEGVFYSCSWSLLWGGGRGVSLDLSIEPRSGTFEALVRSVRGVDSTSVRFPFSDSDLKEALVSAYVVEATSEDQA